MIMILDPLGASLSLLTTYWFVKTKRKAWLSGMLAILVNGYIYLLKGLYGQMALKVLYGFMMVYGWMGWKKAGDDANKNVNVRHMGRKQWTFFLSLGFTLWSLAYWILSEYTASTIPVVDGFIFAFSLIAHYLICERYIESWGFWFVIDIIVTVVHWQRGIPFHSGVHFIYLGFAIAGHMRWKKLAKRQSSSTEMLPEMAG